MTSVNYMELCRLCLVKDKVSIPIFEDDEDSGQILLKIKSCLPIKVAKDDKLPKKICSDCMLKLDNTYQFHKTTTNAEKQLLQWLSETPEVNNVVPSNTIETEQLVLKEEAIELGDQGSDLAKGLCRVETNLGDKLERTASKDEEETESDEDHTNTDDSGDDGLGKEEADSEDEPYEPLEPTTFVNVSIACDEAGPSGIQPTAEAQGEQPPSEFQAPSTSSAAPETASGYARHLLDKFYTTTMRMGSSNSLVNSCYKTDKHNGTHPCHDPGVLFNDNKIVISNVKDYSQSELFTCTRCDKVFYKLYLLNKHMVSHNDARPFKCDVCQKAFKRNFELTNHKKIHVADKTFVCDFCGYATVFKYNLEIHKKRHMRDFKLHCGICNKGYYSNTDLQAHMTCHTGEKHSCAVCGKLFALKQNLNVHLQIHDPERQSKRFECEVCGKSYLRKSKLRWHLRSHAGDAVRFVCDICGKTLTSRESLKTHHRRHTGEKPFICDTCGKAFVSSCYLRVHKRSHTGERPHKCQQCGRSFTQRSTLVVHMRYHSGVRPYNCEFCPKAFVTRTLLRGHIKSHN